MEPGHPHVSVIDASFEVHSKGNHSITTYAFAFVPLRLGATVDAIASKDNVDGVQGMHF
jgi:hypothetical protein